MTHVKDNRATKAEQVPWYRFQRESLHSVLFTIGGSLALLGAFWTPYGMAYVAYDARILSKLDQYIETTASVAEVRWGDDYGQVYFDGSVMVRGKKERVSLAEFAGTRLGMWIDRGVAWPRSQGGAERLIPIGSELPVLYNPSERPSGGGANYRVIPARPNPQAFHRARLRRNLLFAGWPLLLGLPIVACGFWVRSRHNRSSGHN
jgi:hypothetical protein